MSMSLFRTADTDRGLFSPTTTARPRWLRQAELAELEHTLRAAIMSTTAEASRPVTVASAQRADGYAAVVLAGRLDGSAIRAAGAHLRGVLDAGPRHLIVDLSRVDQLDSRLPALLRRVEARMTGLGGIVELTGLGSRLLHDLDDDPLARVFALYRATLDGASAGEVTWARMRCPDGLHDVAEPHTAARHRTIIDNGANHPAPPPTTRPSVRTRVGSGSTPLPYRP
jgi:ABC-type transporter Mla MlaB component